MNVRDTLQRLVKGDVVRDAETRKKFSRDTSIFERTPALVLYPKDAEDVALAVKTVRTAKERGESVSVTARSAGTDMSGGPLTDSVLLVFTKYMNRIREVRPDYAVVEPGVYYRDLEKALAKHGTLIPSYPASKRLCALGGMIANNSGGELTLRYGKTNRYVQELDVVLSDGSQATLRPLSVRELKLKESEQTFEGEIYRRVHELIEKNLARIESARPHVTKNSAGYALWDVFDKKRGTFDLTQLITGSQGTLAIVTKAKMGLVKPKEHRAMLVIFLSDLAILPDVVHRVLRFSPESFESYDDHTFKLAVRFIPQIIGQLGFSKMLRLGMAFLPEVWMATTGGVPKLVLMAEFAEDTAYEAWDKAAQARDALLELSVKTHIAPNEASAEKYWTIRRESFALLRRNLRGLYASPFIDDIVVDPDTYPQFLPELNAILDEHKLIYTIAGHVGDGNFHIIPLMDLSKEEERRHILKLQPKVYALVAKYRGSTTGEHNDGIIRTPYLRMMYGDEVYRLFEEVKKIFDPLNILNPGKKIGGTIGDIERSMIRHG
jgi:FAD/FMN-containing dehydrogenase